MLRCPVGWGGRPVAGGSARGGVAPAPCSCCCPRKLAPVLVDRAKGAHPGAGTDLGCRAGPVHRARSTGREAVRHRRPDRPAGRRTGEGGSQRRRDPERALIEDGWPPEGKAAEAAAMVAADGDIATVGRSDQAEGDRVAIAEAGGGGGDPRVRARMTDGQRRFFDRMRLVARRPVTDGTTCCTGRPGDADTSHGPDAATTDADSPAAHNSHEPRSTRGRREGITTLAR